VSFAEDSVSVIEEVAFSPKGDFLAVWTYDGAWVLQSDGAWRRFLPHSVGRGGIVLSKDGTRLLTRGEIGGIRLWDTSGPMLAEFLGQKDSWGARFGPAEDRVLTWGADETARVWDVFGGEITLPAFGKDDAHGSSHMDFVVGKTLLFAEGLVVGRPRRKISGWGSPGNLLRIAGAPARPPAPVAISSSRPVGFCWDALRSARVPIDVRESFTPGSLVDLVDGGSVRLEASERGNSGGTMSPSGDRFVAWGPTGPARVFDISGRLVAALAGHDGPVLTASWADGGDLVLTCSEDTTAAVWRAEGVLVARLRGHTAPVVGAVLSPDGAHVLTWSRDGIAATWDLRGNRLGVVRGHAQGVDGGWFSPRGTSVLTFSSEDQPEVSPEPQGGLALLSDLTGKTLARIRGHGEIYGLASFTPEGDRVVTCALGEQGRDGSLTVNSAVVRTWDLQGNEVAAPYPPDSPPGGVAVSVRGGRVLAWSRDDTSAHVRDFSGREIAVLPGHPGGVRGASLSADGRLASTVGEDGMARLWEADGRLRATLRDPVGGFWDAVLDPTGRVLFTNPEEGPMRYYLCRNDEVDALATARSTRDFTEAERAEYAELLAD
jgi:WD40 repeat protein